MKLRFPLFVAEEELVYNPVCERARMGELPRQQRGQRVVQRRLMLFAVTSRSVGREIGGQRTGLREGSCIGPMISLVPLGRGRHEQERRQGGVSSVKENSAKTCHGFGRPGAAATASTYSPYANHHTRDDSTGPNHRRKRRFKSMSAGPPFSRSCRRPPAGAQVTPPVSFGGRILDDCLLTNLLDQCLKSGDDLSARHIGQQSRLSPSLCDDLGRRLLARHRRLARPSQASHKLRNCGNVLGRNRVNCKAMRPTISGSVSTACLWGAIS